MKRSICIIEDDVAYCEMFKILLSKKSPNTRVETMYSGIEALDYFGVEESSLPDLFLLDINLPGLDGFQFIDEMISINKVSKNLKIAIISSLDKSSYVERAKHYDSICAFFQKPISNSDLNSILDLSK